MENTTTSPETGPVADAPLSFDEGVSAIANLLDDDPETPDLKTPQEAPKAKTEEASTETVDDDEDLDLQFDDADEEDGAEAEPAPSAVTDETEVTLEDGTKISIGQLKRNNLFQADYSRKTEALKAEKAQFQAEVDRRIAEEHQKIQQEREIAWAYAQHHMPQPPDRSMLDSSKPDTYDPFKYWEEQAKYEQAMERVNAIYQKVEADKQERDQQQKIEFANYFKWNLEQLQQKLPFLKDTAKKEAFKKELEEWGGKAYNLKPEETNRLDYREYLILRDAIAYQKLKAKSKPVREQIAGTPKLEPKQRRHPATEHQRDRQGRFQTLRSTGSLDSAARAIESLLD
jgi:hypothetical protein